MTVTDLKHDKDIPQGPRACYLRSFGVNGPMYDLGILGHRHVHIVLCLVHFRGGRGAEPTRLPCQRRFWLAGLLAAWLWLGDLAGVDRPRRHARIRHSEDPPPPPPRPCLVSSPSVFEGRS